MSYTYRVTAEVVTLSDGRKAHIAKYAYKPLRGWFGRGNNYKDQENARMHFKSGCVASENMTLKNDLIVTFDPDTGKGTLYHNVAEQTVFDDDFNFGSPRMPKLADIQRTAPKKFQIVA